MALTNAEKQLLKCSVLQHLDAMKRKIGIRTQALIELGGEHLLSESDKYSLKTAQPGLEWRCKCMVLTRELDELIKASESTREAREASKAEAAKVAQVKYREPVQSHGRDLKSANKPCEAS